MPRWPFSMRVTHEAATSISLLTVLAVNPLASRSSRSSRPRSRRLNVGVVSDGTGVLSSFPVIFPLRGLLFNP